MITYDVALVTYRDLPSLTADDQLLVRELERRGVRARTAVWSDPSIDWSDARLTVLRSTWDYFRRPRAFLDWLDWIELETCVLNAPALIRWNHDKHYLEDLSEKGIATLPTIFVDRYSSAALGEAAAIFRTSDLVIKPAIGGASHRTRRFAIDQELSNANAHLKDVLGGGSAMIQPFVSSVLDQRERSLVFLGGDFSHAYLKTPFSAGAIAGEAGEIAHTPSTSELALARQALASCSQATAYARVDMVILEGAPHLMELELIEPALHFGLALGSQAKFADVLEQALMRSAAGLGCAA